VWLQLAKGHQRDPLKDALGRLSVFVWYFSGFVFAIIVVVVRSVKRVLLLMFPNRKLLNMAHSKKQHTNPFAKSLI
jgi:hypothetical protein